uniref:Carboxylic ester hydrolase n=2 Tax=Meloidogyne incognita group TaxID=654580 RepID=A0A915MQD5_MELJA
MVTTSINSSSFPSFTHPFCISAKKVFSSSSTKDYLPLPYAYTDKGPVEGKLHQMKDGRYVNVFLGIPFAKPPIGQLRFKKPEEPEPWGPLALPTRKYKSRPIQKDFIWDRIELGGVGKSEDCLYLNVFTPSWNKPPEFGNGWPVMVYIHGGGFIIDSAVKYHYSLVSRALVRHGVIVVTLQYRLGLLGFLCTGNDGVCPGNMGLWDQLYALQWVNKNISSFGGDPNKITLFGHSAGAAAIDLLSLCPKSRNLFSQMIIIGGSTETTWGVTSKDVIAEYTRKRAKDFGFVDKDDDGGGKEWNEEKSKKMMKFLRSLPAEKFEMTLLLDQTIINEMRLAVSPVIDGELVPKSPRELRDELDVCKPVICGHSQHEGLLFQARKRMPNEQLANKLIPLVDEFDQLYNIPKMVAGRKLKIFEDKTQIQNTCVTIMSDLISNIATQNYCHLNMKKPKSHIWRFIFEHYNSDSTWSLNPFFPFKASTHGNELNYIFGINFFVTPWRRTEADKTVKKLTTKYFTNFAKWGDPNEPAGSSEIYPHWDPLSEDNIEKYLNITSEPEMRDGFDESKRWERMGYAYRAFVE